MNRVLVDHAWKDEKDPILRAKYTSFLKQSHSTNKNKHTFYERQALDVIIKEGIMSGRKLKDEANKNKICMTERPMTTSSPLSSSKKVHREMYPIPERNESKYSVISRKSLDFKRKPSLTENENKPQHIKDTEEKTVPQLIKMAEASDSLAFDTMT
jgi:hypothetical protein